MRERNVGDVQGVHIDCRNVLRLKGRSITKDDYSKPIIIIVDISIGS